MAIVSDGTMKEFVKVMMQSDDAAECVLCEIFAHKDEIMKDRVFSMLCRVKVRLEEDYKKECEREQEEEDHEMNCRCDCDSCNP